MKLNELLIKWRNNQALTQEQMAFRIGINRCLYCQIENGKTDFGKSTIQKIAKLLKITNEQVVELIKEK